jgi:cellulose synthase/poly-beta-1,6-N-acetylglucosamine synthase-like glycosyltransferase
LSQWIRQTHRWLSIAFTIAVIANIVAMLVAPGATWIGFLALVPLIPLLFTGLYMFVQPYRARSGPAS